MSSNAKISGVDLFCGVGGLTHGLERAGIDIAAGVDVDPACRYPFEKNNDSKFVERDIAEITAKDLNVLFDDGAPRLLAGCAPCQPFSTYSRSGRSKKRPNDWQLVAKFGSLVEDLQPEYVTMENVPQLADHEVFADFLSKLKGYSIDHRIVKCETIGIPQTRSRLVLLAAREGAISMDLSSGEGQTTVREAIYGLPKLNAGGVDSGDPIHRASRLSPLNLRRIQASKPGGTWRDWPEDLRATCHQRESGETYPSVYGRMEWDEPSPTITTQCFGYGNGRFGHPEQDRAISLREAAVLQTFPTDYEFVAPHEPVRFNRLGRLIGNAVPVRLAEVVGKSLITHEAQRL